MPRADCFAVVFDFSFWHIFFTFRFSSWWVEHSQYLLDECSDLCIGRQRERPQQSYGLRINIQIYKKRMVQATVTRRMLRDRCNSCSESQHMGRRLACSHTESCFSPSTSHASSKSSPELYRHRDELILSCNSKDFQMYVEDQVYRFLS